MGVGEGVCVSEDITLPLRVPEAESVAEPLGVRVCKPVCVVLADSDWLAVSVTRRVQDGLGVDVGLGVALKLATPDSDSDGDREGVWEFEGE